MEFLSQGATQADRHARELGEGAPRVEDFQLTEYLNFVRDFSSQVAFWGSDGNPDGTWAPFFERDRLFALADIGRTDLTDFEVRHRLLDGAFRGTALQSEREGILARFLALDCDMADLLLSWRRRVVEVGGAESDPEIAVHFDELFRANVGDELAVVSTVYDRMFREFAIAPDRLAGAEVSSKSGRLQVAFDALPRSTEEGSTGATSWRSRVDELTGPDRYWEYLDGMYRHLSGTLGQLKRSIPDFLGASLEHAGHPPHVALLLAFREMAGPVVDRLNGLVERHLEFQYRTVLGQKPRGSIADKAWLLLRADPTTPRVEVSKGTSFSAGPGMGGRDILYRTEREVVVTRATAISFRRVFNGTLSSDPRIATAGAVLAFPVADSGDGFGAALTGSPASWPAFGEGSVPNSGTPAQASARLGFMVGSPVLFLRDGRREIRVRIALNRAGLEALFASLRGLGATAPPTASAPDPSARPTSETVDDSLLKASWIHERIQACGEEAERIGNYADVELLPCLRLLKELRLVGKVLARVVDEMTDELGRITGSPGSGEGHPQAPTAALAPQSRWQNTQASLVNLPNQIAAAFEERKTTQDNLAKILSSNPWRDALASAVADLSDFRNRSDTLRRSVESALAAVPSGDKPGWWDWLTGWLSGQGGSGGNSVAPVGPPIPSDALESFRASRSKLASTLARNDSTDGVTFPAVDALHAAESTGIFSVPEEVSVFPETLKALDSDFAALDARLGSLTTAGSGPVGDFEAERTLVPQAKTLVGIRGDLGRVEARIVGLLKRPLVVHDLSEPSPILGDLLASAPAAAGSGADAVVPSAPVGPTAGSPQSPPSGTPNPVAPDTDDLENLSERVNDLADALDGTRRELVLSQVVRPLLDKALSGIAKTVDTRMGELSLAMSQTSVTGRSAEFRAALDSIQQLEAKASTLGEAGAAYAEVLGELKDAELELGGLWGSFLSWLDDQKQRLSRTMARVSTDAGHADTAVRRLMERLGASFTHAAEVRTRIGAFVQDEEVFSRSGDTERKDALGMLAELRTGDPAVPEKETIDALVAVKARLTSFPTEPLWSHAGRLFELAFSPEVTVADAWRSPSNYRARSFVVLDQASPSGTAATCGVDVSLWLEPSYPAVVGYDPKVHGGGVQASFPLVRFLMNQRVDWPWPVSPADSGSSAGNPYPLWAGVTLDQVNLRTEVRGSKAYSAQNSLSSLDPKSPFLPLGASPVVGMEFRVGNVEMFRKPLAYLGVDIEWFDLPTLPGGFGEYYSAYNKYASGVRLTNAAFRWRAEWLAAQRWHSPPVLGTALRLAQAPSSVREVDSVELFSWHSQAPTPESSTKIVSGAAAQDDSSGKLDPVSRFFLAGLSGVTSADDPQAVAFVPVTPYVDGQSNGCLRFTLTDPSYAFGSSVYPAVVTAQSAAWASTVVAAVSKKVDPKRAGESGNTDAMSAYVQRLANLAEALSPEQGPIDKWVARITAAIPDPGIASPASTDAASSSDPPAPHAAPPPPPPPPFVPKIKQMRFDYGAETVWKWTTPSGTGSAVWIHVHPFGLATVASSRTSESVSAKEAVSLVAGIPNEGTLFIGLKDLPSREVLTLLVMLQEGSGSGDLALPRISWSYLNAGKWVSFPHAGMHDGTRGWVESGIVSLRFPGEVETSSTLFLDGPGLAWIQVSVPRESAAFCDVIRIATQAVSARYWDGADPDTHFANGLPAGTIAKTLQAVPGLIEVVQPAASIGGRGPESANEFRTRVREHLRHKGRAVTPWDWERIVLQEFVSIWAVRCLSANELGADARPGQVTLLVVPAPATPGIDSLAPRAGVSTLEGVRAFLSVRADPFCRIDARSPAYRYLQVRTIVDLDPAAEPGREIGILAQALVAEIAPWSAGQTERNPFSHAVNHDGLRRFLEAQPSVRAVIRFELRLYPTSTLEGPYEPGLGSQPIRAGDPCILVTSASTHLVFPSTVDDETIQNVFENADAREGNPSPGRFTAFDTAGGGVPDTDGSSEGANSGSAANPWRFERVDLEQPGRMALELLTPSDAPGEFLRSLLSANAVANLAAWDHSQPVPLACETNLLDLLNRVVRGASIWDSERFATTTLRDETKRLTESHLEGNSVSRLNRLLLEDAFPTCLARVHDALYVAGDYREVPDTGIRPPSLPVPFENTETS